jgi:SAM-dependent methyltransferase
MLSVVIPTHQPQFIHEAVASVLDQTESDFEVVVVPNSTASVDGLLPADDRIRVVPYPGFGTVGAIKRFGFEAAHGEILVELDHDDVLAPQALQRVKEAVAETQADFVYSNFAELNFDTGAPVTYDGYWGWRSRPATVRGRPVTEMVAFDPAPAAIGRIWYAPNHVRAWTRDGYVRAGGHNPALPVCDDHDLLVRTYLTGRMRRIDECLYLQRSHPGRTTSARNAEIQKTTAEIYARSIESLVVRWAGLQGLPCYQIGGADQSAPGWVTFEGSHGRTLADLRYRWPWDDSSVGAFNAHDLLQYLPDKQHTMNEIHRCLAPGGWLLSTTPSALGQGAYMDPRICSQWVRNSFYYWTDAAYARHIGNRHTRFQVHRLEDTLPSEWHRNEQMPCVHFDGVCLKGGFDGPGPHQI